jgi:tetratricopeptide (TPR) repeat protein
MFALGTGLYSAGRWDESREAYGHALRLIPGDVSIIRLIAGISLSEGDLAAARRQLSVALPADARMRLLAHMAVYGDFYWVLDRAQQDSIMTLGAEYFEDDRASRALVFAQILHARGDPAGARRWAGEAAREFEQHSAGSDDPQMPALAGMAHAYLGHHDQARRWLDQAGAEAAGNDRDTRGYLHELDARARLLAGDEAGAIASLEKFALEASRTGPGRIALNPEFARLRGNPRFDRIAVPYRAPRS